MYVRVTPFVLDLAREQEVTRFSEEQLLPAIRQLPGFRRYTAAVDRAAGRGVSLTEWDSQEHAQALRTAVGGMLQEMAELGIQLETAQVYEVLVQA